MALRIDPSHNRFRDIVRGKIKQNLRKYISNGEWLGRKGKDVVSIPVPQIEMPRFRFGDQGQGGVAQGPGKVGDSLGPAEPGEEGIGSGQTETDPEPAVGFERGESLGVAEPERRQSFVRSSS